MKKIELIMLKLRDFKGIKSLDIEVNGGNARFYGDNATGKTTVFDAFLWLLFDKDSNNKKDFKIKTLTAAGKEINNLEHTVEGSFLVDRVLVQFKKVYKEVWTKKRGAANKEFTGHTTDYFVDEVPVNKKEYTAKVESIVHEDVFKLLTTPSYFNEQLKWQERRNILLEVCGDISDEDVIASEKSLALLNDVLSGKSIDDMKKIIASKKKNINDELEKIPVRIDEISKMMPEINVDVEALNKQVSEIESEIDGLKSQKHNVLNGAAVLEKQKQLQEIDMQLNDLKRTFESDSLQEVHKLQVRVQEAQGNVQIIQSDVRLKEQMKQSQERESNQLTNDISQVEGQLVELRKEWSHHNGRQFEYEDNCTCPSCKQELPPDQLVAARAEALAQFNDKKSSALAEINGRGKSLAEKKKQLEERQHFVNNELNNTSEQLTDIGTKLEAAQKELAKYTEKLQQAQSVVQDVSTTEAYQTLMNQKQSINNEITSLKASANEVASDIEVSIYQLEQQRKANNAELAQFANIEASKARIAELEREQKQLAEQYEELEGNLHLIETFTRKKVEMLTERINSKFKYARFKLFEEQVNGGLNEVCETLYEGVPYGSNLNNAAKINVGLDIINTLSAHYGIYAPIFVDNAESVTKFIDVDTQLISLVVSEKDKQLRVEVEPVEYKEAI